MLANGRGIALEGMKTACGAGINCFTIYDES